MSNYVIRYGTIEDTVELNKMGSEFCKEYGLPYDEDSGVNTMNVVLALGFVIVITLDNKICGCIGAIIQPSIFKNDYQQCNEIMYYVYPEYRGSGVGQQLLSSYEQVATERGCKYITLIAPEAMKKGKLDILYRRRKFREFETTYIKEL